MMNSHRKIMCCCVCFNICFYFILHRRWSSIKTCRSPWTVKEVKMMTTKKKFAMNKLFPIWSDAQSVFEIIDNKNTVKLMSTINVVSVLSPVYGECM